MNNLKDKINTDPVDEVGIQGDSDVFPKTLYVIEFGIDTDNRAVALLVQRLRGKRSDGGAELLVKAHPLKEKVGRTLSVLKKFCS